MALTDIAVRRTNKSGKYADGRGLYLQVTPAGGKYWRYAYRFNNKQKTLALGTYPDIGLSKARERHQEARSQLAVGTDPGAIKKAAKTATSNTFEAPERAISEMRRVTRPGGTVPAATWDSRGGFLWLRMFWDTAAMLDPEAIVRRARVCARPLTRPGDLERAWKAAGLTDVVQDMLTIRMDFASFEDFWAPFDGTDGPFAEYVRTLKPEAKTVLRDKVRLAYVDGESDGPRSYAATSWVVKGRVPG